MSRPVTAVANSSSAGLRWATRETMELVTPSTEVARAGLRAIKDVAMADGQFHQLEHDLIAAAQRYALDTDFDLEALEPISPEELAATVPPEAMFRERIVNAAIVVALIDGEMTERESQAIQRIASALGIESRALEDVHRLANRCATMFRVDIVRRCSVGQRLLNYLKTRGLSGAVSLLKSVAHLTDDRVAGRYQALERLPDGTLGRELYRFTRANGFPFPGERGGPPEMVIFHDCLHVLGEYGTTPEEECEIISFQAGNIVDDHVFSLFFALGQFQLGLRLNPIITPQKMALRDPARIYRGFVRGCKVNRELCVSWQPWDDMDRDCGELRREFNIVPRVQG